MGLVSNVQIRGSSYYINGTNTYTALGVPLQKSWTKNGYIVNTKYAYKNGAGGENARSTQIASVRYSKGEQADDQGYSYNYDDVGNITRVGILNDSDGFTRAVDYHYDKNNQLIRVDDKPNNQTVQYVYDVQGNLIQRTYHPYTTAETVTSTATRTDTWTYGGRDNNVIRGSTIDGVTTSYAYSYYGRPNNWTDGRAITWQNGTQIASIGDVTFTYDDGQRTSKTANNVTTNYIYEGDKLIMMERDGTRLFFLYDQNGVFGFDYITADSKKTYYYRIDGKGEIVALTNASGAVVANYNYDPWGKILSVKTPGGTTITNTENVALLNPFRYKSYVYDNETELYYLNSRYYDPQVCRFVSRDAFEYLGATGYPMSYNLFAYCMNNPVMEYDPSGNIPPQVLVILASAAVGAGLGAYNAYCTGGNMINAAVVGGLTSAISAGVGLNFSQWAGAAIAGIAGFAVELIAQTATSECSITDREVWLNAANTGVTAGIATWFPTRGENANTILADALETIVYWSYVSLEIAYINFVAQTTHTVKQSSNVNHEPKGSAFIRPQPRPTL